MARTSTANVHVRCTTREKRAFKRACDTNGTTCTSVLRQMMSDYVKGRITYHTNLETA